MEYDIIPERSSENAKKALELAVERGFKAEDVLTFRGGYYVPVEVDTIETEPGTEDEEPIEIIGEIVPEGTEVAPAVLTDTEGKTIEPDADGVTTLHSAEETPAPAPKTARKRTAKKE